jgi:hypothetical protein
MPGREGELPAQPSNRCRTQEHKDSSQRADRNNTRLEARPAVEQEAKGEPRQLPVEYTGLDRDRPGPDTNTIQDPQSTTNRSDFHAIRETSARRAKRRYRAHENVRYRRAKKVLVSPDQGRAMR